MHGIVSDHFCLSIVTELEERTKQLKMMEERQSAERARREEEHKR